MDKAKLIEIIYAALPYSSQITGISLDEKEAVTFSWRGHTLRVNENLFCEEVEGNLLSRSDLALLVEALLKRVWAEKEVG